MGYISASGTRFAALISASVLLPVPLGASSATDGADVNPSKDAAITLTISGLRSQKGRILVCLTAQAEHFPDCRKDDSARKISVAANGSASVKIDGVAPGTYALALVHDENSNGKMDMALFVPKEGFGFSRNPRIGMGPPKFRSAQFSMNGQDANYAVRMKYIF